MPILEVRNITFNQISTTIGVLKPVEQGGEPLRVQFDVVPKKVVEELEIFRKRNWLEFSILEDPDFPDDVEAQAATALIGAPTFGSLPPGLDPKQSIADAFQAAIGGSAATIGVPTVGDYLSAIPTIDDSTRIADAFQAFGNFNALIAPAKPETLLGQELILVGATLFSAKIPSGLATTWNPLTPGQTITNLIVDGTFTLESPDQANRFLAGFAGNLLTAGSLDLIEDGSVSETYDISVNGVGIIGRISITDISIHNSVWQKVNAEFIITLSVDGRHRFAMDHTESGLSNEREFYFDDVNTAPSFSSAMGASINTVISKYLSGIEALGFGSTIDIVYTAAIGIFTKTYHPTMVGQVTGPGHTTSLDNPAITPNFADPFPVSRSLTLNAVNQFSLSPSYTATISKPDGQNASSVDSIPQPVNTYGIISTGKDDQFFDEARRIVLDSGTTFGTATLFDSTASLVNGNAQQRHDGTLQFPNITDYPGFTGDQEYQRFFDKAGASTGAITFQGVLFSNISPFGTGNLNVLIELAVQGKFFDLGRSVGSNNGDGSGNSRANSVGARNDGLSSGNILAWSLGVDSTAFNNNEYRMIVIFKNTTHIISRITEA